MFNFFSKIERATPKQAHDAWQADREHVAILDVRTLEEVREMSIPGALHIPLDVLPSELDRLRGYSSVYSICRSGGRSSRATMFLADAGIPAANIDGGVIAWEHAGLPTVR